MYIHCHLYFYYWSCTCIAYCYPKINLYLAFFRVYCQIQWFLVFNERCTPWAPMWMVSRTWWKTYNLNVDYLEVHLEVVVVLKRWLFFSFTSSLQRPWNSWQVLAKCLRVGPHHTSTWVEIYDKIWMPWVLGVGLICRLCN